MPDEPIVVLHIALCDEISSSMAGIVASASRLSSKCPPYLHTIVETDLDF